MSNIKEIASIHVQFKETAKKIAEGSESVVDLYKFYMDDIFLCDDEDKTVLEYIETILIKDTCIVSIDTLNPKHLIRAYEEFLLEPHQEYENPERYLEFLEEVMSWISGTGFYFGSSEGDGACIGYWKIEDEDNS